MYASSVIPKQTVENHYAYRNKSKGFATFGRSYLNGLHLFILFLLGASLLLTNRWFTEMDDECAIIDRAAQPILHTIRLYLIGVGEHEHPPLYDLILHAWLQLTAGAPHLLRLPAVIFYLAGAWMLANAAEQQAGRAARGYTVLLIALWPYGFHFGRVATWYSFCFLLVALVTRNYFRYSEDPRFANWCWLVLCSVLLLYSNYFAWALMGCLVVDFIIQNRTMSPKQWAGLTGTGLLLLTGYVPIAGAFFTEIRKNVQLRPHVGGLVLYSMYSLYSVFLSESVAPWFWGFGVPAAAAVAISIFTCFGSRLRIRRFLIYFALVLALMTVLGVADTKRMLFVSPWLILPVGVTIAQAGKLRRTLSAALLFIAAVGWYGIVSRSLYAAPHWIEPWGSIAQNAANVAHDGGIVIGNNPSFFFYLTYDLVPNENIGSFPGLLPASTRRTNVYDLQQWIEAGRPAGRRTMIVRGMPYPNAPMDEAERWLSSRCVLANSARLVHDPGAALKERFAPEKNQAPWRIEIATFACP